MNLPKKLKTKGGYDVTVLTTTARGAYPIVGLIHSKRQPVDDVHTWTSRGLYHENTPNPTMDLILKDESCGQ